MGNRKEGRPKSWLDGVRPTHVLKDDGLRVLAPTPYGRHIFVSIVEPGGCPLRKVKGKVGDRSAFELVHNVRVRRGEDDKYWELRQGVIIGATKKQVSEIVYEA